MYRNLYFNNYNWRGEKRILQKKKQKTNNQTNERTFNFLGHTI